MGHSLREWSHKNGNPKADIGLRDIGLRLARYRYEKGSILITTNKAVKDWPKVLVGDEVMAAGLLDRFLHRCHVLNMKGPSYRLRGLERLVK